MLPTPWVILKVSSPSQNTSNHSGTGICDKTSFPKTLSNISCDSVVIFLSKKTKLGVQLPLTDRKE
jgi:hypothetical protein